MEAALQFTVVDLDRMVRTIWGEARSESEETWQAIAKVILTRAGWPGRSPWGNSIDEVCTAPWQFACWNPNDPNRLKMLNLTSKDKRYKAIEEICLDLLKNGEYSDVGATFYCRSTAKPVWRKDLKPVETVGKYVFFAISPNAGYGEELPS